MNGQIKVNNTIFSCIRQAFTGTHFFLAMVGIFVALAVGGFSDVWAAFEKYKKGLLDYGVHYEVLKAALKSDAICLLLPVFCAIPFTAAFLEDFECGFIKTYLPRAGRGHYIFGKILATGISGGAVITVGIEIYYGLLSLILLPMERAITYEQINLTYGKDVGKACVLFFCAGMLFSLIGMLFSILTSSKYMAYASPFVVEFVLIILHERYMKKVFIISPKEWINPTVGQWYLDELGAVLFMLAIDILVSILVAMAMQRRLDEI